ncbi:hypothetical protein ACQPZU_09770 [Saccharomonospora azurea]|uniref:Uncharacterized protein n=1 Tax=Saccharomonospora azurea NA-128 TaxID=882081 RepID=H8G642_9PSEU|nr:hypothetical protein [Saccharomonospora azurea]EHY87202.1 hypothetical protein SacazDRAFT_00215 [Saccharomonospora azurea NA-128]
MSIAPQTSSVGTGSTHVVGEPAHAIVFADGTTVEILSSYPVRPDADLHSLARAVEFACAHCREHCEATLVAVRDDCLLCPGCYAALDVVQAAPATEIPDARSAA